MDTQEEENVSMMIQCNLSFVWRSINVAVAVGLKNVIGVGNCS